MRFVVFYFSIYLNCFFFMCLLFDITIQYTVYVTAGCVYLTCQNICRMHGAANVCYRWNTQHFAHVGGHTISLHHLYTHDHHYTWPNVTNLEH
jgi:hypothetical protein